MSQDIVADGINQILNAKKARKNSITLEKSSKVLMGVLAIAKLKGYVLSYKMDKNKVFVDIGELNFCKAVKPRYVVKAGTIDKYVRRYLPGRGIGILIITTSQGLMTHQTAIEKGLGGSIIAYMY